jgi:hypothetical protein
MTKESISRLVLISALVCVATVPLCADQDYVATSNGSIIEYNTLTGASLLLGTNSTVIYGLGYNSGVLYANDSGASPNVGFYSVNPANGALTTVGDISGATSGTGGITAPLGGGTIYFFDHSNQLFTINPATASATTVGSLGFTVSGSWDICFAANGQLYATSNGLFYQVDLTTGAATLLGNSGAQLQGLIPGEGGLYGFSGTSMYSIDLTDGALTFVRNTPSALGNFENGTAMVTASTPEPNSALLLGTGVLGLLAVVRRKINL